MKINFVLRPGKDDDLINWWEESIKGDRSHLIREALRQYVAQQKAVKELTNNPKTEIISSNNDRVKTSKATQTLEQW